MGKSSFLQDFKAFAMRGNVIDMAVGVIIGGAFGKIVSSIVADVIMPPIGLLVGGVNFTDLKLQLKPAEVVDGVEKAAVTLNYGNFLQATFDFIIIAFSKVIPCSSNFCKTAGLSKPLNPIFAKTGIVSGYFSTIDFIDIDLLIYILTSPFKYQSIFYFYFFIILVNYTILVKFFL